MGKQDKPRVGENPLLPFIGSSKESQASTQANTQASTQAEKQAQAQANAKAKHKANANHKAQASKQAAMAAEVVKGRVGLPKPGRLEDIRTRRTYWLTDEDIEKVDLLASETGLAKHDIIGAAVSYLYSYVFGGGDDS